MTAEASGSAVMMRRRSRFRAAAAVLVVLVLGCYSGLQDRQGPAHGDMLEVDAIKDVVKSMNAELRYYKAKDQRGRDIRFRTTLKARKPINKVVNKRTGNMIGHTSHGDVIGGMENAAAVDVYIHRYLSDAMWKQGRNYET